MRFATERPASCQGDDLAQMGFPPIGESTLASDQPSPDANEAHSRLRQFTKRLYPNFLQFLDGPDRGRAGLANEWPQMAATTAAGLTVNEKDRLDHLDSRVSKAFYAGELNPSLVSLAMHSPDYFMQTMDLN